MVNFLLKGAHEPAEAAHPGRRVVPNVGALGAELRQGLREEPGVGRLKLLEPLAHQDLEFFEPHY